MKALLLAALLSTAQPHDKGLGDSSYRRFNHPISAICGSRPFVNKYDDWVTTKSPGPDGYWVDWDCTALDHYENHT